MQTFDVATATLLVSVLYIVMPTITWFVLGDARNGAVKLWCAGGFASGIATLFISVFSGGTRPLLAVSIPAFLYFFSFIFRAQSLRMELGRPFLLHQLVPMLVGSTLVFEFLHRGIGLYAPRAIFASFVTSTFATLMSLYAMQIASAEQSKLARWIALAYGAVALAFLFRMAYLSQEDFSRTVGSSVTDGVASVIAATVLLLSSVIGHFGYVGLYLERSQRQSIFRANEQARADVSQELGAQMAALERRQSLGEFAASIGHELNQPLTAILTNTQLTKRGLQAGRLAPEAVLQLLDKIEYNTQRASSILERIRNFMRAGTAKCERVNLFEVLQSVLQMLQADLDAQHIKVELGGVNPSLWVMGDALEFSQVLLNVIKNAAESMSGLKVRRISIAFEVVQGKAHVRVRDTGQGLNEEQQAKAANPFFTTKRQGLGMGLAIAQGIMRRHRGSLKLTNADDGAGPGALVVLELPLDQDAA